LVKLLADTLSTPDALRAALLELDPLQPDTLDADATYHRILYAVRNNHAGTLYPIVCEAVPVLLLAARIGRPVVREVALDVLYDLLSFETDPAFVGRPDCRDLARSVARLIRAHEAALRDAAQQLPSTTGVRSKITDLLNALDE
jgi:hypothetical protein